MTSHRGSETDFENTTIERLLALGYGYEFGMDIARDHREVVLRDRLRDNLAKRYAHLPPAALDAAVAVISRPEGADTLRRNQRFHTGVLRAGFDLPYERTDGGKAIEHIHPVDWDDSNANDLRVVNQFPIAGKNDRRPDIIIFINGLPLVVFELKNPWSEKPTVDEALNQIAHYRQDISQLFDFNGLVVISDGLETLHGMWTATKEWYAPWKSIDGVAIEPATTASMKMLVEGLFQKPRLLEYLRDFIVCETANDVITKKGAKYHQFFAVKEAVARSLSAHRRVVAAASADRRIGVIWHTTGSGKSLSMAFLVGILRRQSELQNPSIVIQVDRTDLDDQLHDQFVAARHLVGEVKHANSVEDLRRLLQTGGGEVIFTTIEKFRLTEGESSHPVLSQRSNLIVIADEAHRTQYGFTQGYARYLSEALPNALRLGFTGTPISFHGSDTVEVFGEVIHTYDIKQAQDDRATVPIFYAPRQIKLHLGRQDMDAALTEIADQHAVGDLERRKSRWAALAAAAGAKDRVAELAKDLLAHFRDRTATLKGKAMVVCMTRENCVRVYDALKALPDCPELAVVMTGDLGKDPEAWSIAGHLTTKAKRDAIKKRMVDPDDTLAIVIVCDMWLTGTDIPCLHTLYIDKPMQGHTMIQAISRVNRVFRDKPHGLVVDYIGIGDDLRAATAKYTSGGGKGDPAPGMEAAKRVFLECLDALRVTLPSGKDYAGWRKLGAVALEDLYAFVYGTLTETNDRQDAFLQAELRISSAFLLVKHLDECRGHADEIIFYQRVRKELEKTKAKAGKPRHEVEQAVRDLVDDSVDSEGVVDIFKVAGIERADISILDDHFLQTFKDKPHENLRLKLLEKLLHDEIQLRRRQNLAMARSFQEMLEKTLQKYHNRLIDAAAVIRALIQIRKDMDAEEGRANQLGLAAEELAFYDAVAANAVAVYGERFLCDLIHDVVKVIKSNLKVDWTEPHREDVKASIRAAVRRVLTNRKVKAADFDAILAKVMEQAEQLFGDWPKVA